MMLAALSGFPPPATALAPMPPHLTTEGRADLIAKLQLAGVPSDNPTFGANWSGLEITLTSVLGPHPKNGTVVYRNRYPDGFLGQASARAVGGCDEVHLTGWYKREPTRVVRVDGLYCVASRDGVWDARRQTVSLSVEPGGPPPLPGPGAGIAEIGPGGPD
jgi:hypothetical protein